MYWSLIALLENGEKKYIAKGLEFKQAKEAMVDRGVQRGEFVVFIEAEEQECFLI